MTCFGWKRFPVVKEKNSPMGQGEEETTNAAVSRSALTGVGISELHGLSEGALPKRKEQHRI